VNVLEWAQPVPRLGHLWRDPKMAMLRQSPSNLMELDVLQRKWGIILKKDFEGVIGAKRCLLSKGCELKNVIYLFF